MEITTIRKNDIFFGEVDVGNLPPLRAQAYMNAVKESFTKHFSNKIILIAAKGTGNKLKILRSE